MTVAQINALPHHNSAPHGQRAQWPQRVLAEVAPLEQKGVVAEGFLVGAKQEGRESTNCKRQDQLQAPRPQRLSSLGG